MSDTPVPAEQTTGPDHEVEVDLAAFLPEGVELGEPKDDPEDELGDEDEPELGDEDEPVRGPATPDGSGAPDPAVLDAIQADLDAVDAALLTLDAGTYGTCATCGAPIPDEALAADPTRTACAAH